MKKLITGLLLCLATGAEAQDILQQMYTKNASGFRRSLSFVQETNFYRNDSLVNKATWFEVLVYPDKLRIDINNPDDGNAIFYVNDSAFRFQNYVLKSKGPQKHDLLFLLGGMYYFPLPEVYTKLREFGYDTDKTYETTWKGRAVVVVGANKDETESNQFWVDKEKMVTVRILNNKGGQHSEIVCGDYRRLGTNWCETAIDFYVEGKLRQQEKYMNLRENFSVNLEYLDPHKMGKVKFWGR